MKRGKLVECNGVELPNGEVIKQVEKDGYKYLGVLELDRIMESDMKERFSKEYFRRFSNDIGMQFGLDKCAVLIIKRGKIVKSEGIELPNDEKIRSLKEDDSYKYLGILQSNEIQRKDMKEKVGKEYKRRVRKMLETKLNGGNIIKAINTWAIPMLRYSASFLDWTISELQEMDRRTRKLMTMHNALHPSSNVDRLYIPRSEGGRGILSVEDTVNLAKLGLQG